MAKWKYTKPKKMYTSTFLQFEEGKTKKIAVTNWLFERSSAGYLFKCYVEKEDGEETDKIWCVWDFDSTELLKKKLGTKYRTGAKELTVTMRKNDDEEQYFEID